MFTRKVQKEPREEGENNKENFFLFTCALDTHCLKSLKDVWAKIFYNTDFCHAFSTVRSIMSYLCQKCKKTEVTDFIFEINRVKNYPDFDKSVIVIRQGVSGC